MHRSMLCSTRSDTLSEKGLRIDPMSATCLLFYALKRSREGNYECERKEKWSSIETSTAYTPFNYIRARAHQNVCTGMALGGFLFSPASILALSRSWLTVERWTFPIEANHNQSSPISRMNLGHLCDEHLLATALVEIHVISFQVQEWIWAGSCKELFFFPEETTNSWKKCVIGKFPRSFQDLKRGSLLKARCSPFHSNQDPDQEVAKSW